MAITSKHISYHKTGYFNPLVLDYINQGSSLFSLPLLTPDLSGLKKAIELGLLECTNETEDKEAYKIILNPFS